MLSDAQIERYSRQIILPQVGGKGQEKLCQARILVSGNGLLQSTTLLYLAAAGIGTLGTCADAPLPVFPAFTGNQASQQEAVSEALTRLNPDCAVVVHQAQEMIWPERLVERYDLILSAQDSLHDACYAQHRPCVYAQVQSAEAWLFTCKGYEPDQPCLRCFLTQPREDTAIRESFFSPSSATEALSAMFLGALQVTEALKLVLEIGLTSHPKLLHCQFPGMRFTERLVQKNPHCSLCGQGVA